MIKANKQYKFANEISQEVFISASKTENAELRELESEISKGMDELEEMMK